MGLGSFLIETIVEKAADAAAMAAITTTAIVTGGVVETVGTVVDGVKSRGESVRKRKEDEQDYTQYDLDLFYAKVAMCAYIANADHNLSPDERTINFLGGEFGNQLMNRSTTT